MTTSDSILLIIDDESSVCRALSRILRRKANEIITAQTIVDAELVLDTRDVTHVLCDHLLGPGSRVRLALDPYVAQDKVVDAQSMRSFGVWKWPLGGTRP